MAEGVTRIPPRAGDPDVTPEVVGSHGLSVEEFQRIVRILGREPTFTELGLFGAMWSERCGHKSSKRLLRLLPTQAPWVIQGPGERAGVIDVGDGFALAFGIEAHSHPSAVEPYQGAAAAVGGILRDVFTMGARPIAVLDSLRFGDLGSGRVRSLLSGVVAGVGDYGNGVAIPNIGGETFFDRGYEGNPVVNAMCLGLLKHDQLIRASASGTGSALMAVGGREKLLLEASLELIASGAVTGIQNVGAAGITCSASEMAARGGSGVEIDVARVPVREPGMTPRDILLSESQERMLVVAEPGKEAEVRRILEKWELEAAVIGQVTDDGRFRVLEDGRVVADVPTLPLTEGCPTYEREGVESPEVQALRAMDLSEHAKPSGDLSDLFLRMVGSPNVASKRWVYGQYDATVPASIAVRPGGDAGVVRIPGTRRAVAAKTDCNGRHVYLDPGVGTRAAVAEAARNLACVGALPTAITHSLNFGDPLKPHVYHQLREAVVGMAEACRIFETPVTGGNVSFHDETDGRAIYPTPVIGMVGVVEDVDDITPQAFLAAGDAVILLGRNTGELGGSEYLYVTADLVAGAPPAVDLLAERSLQQAVLAMIHERKVRSAHDCAEGGLACALAESAVGWGEEPRGVDVALDDDLPPVAVLFGEATGRVVVSCAPEDAADVLRIAERHGVAAGRIGSVGEVGGRFRIHVKNARVEVDVARVADAFYGAIPAIMDAPAISGV